MFQVEILKEGNEKVLAEINALTAKLSLSVIPPKPMSKGDLMAMLSQKDFYCLVVKNQKEIVGLVVMYFTIIPTGLIAEAEDLIVDEAYRKWGVGPMLIQKAVEIAEASGAKHISLRTNPKRAEANKMYQSIGFKQIETNFYRINLPRGK